MTDGPAGAGGAREVVVTGTGVVSCLGDSLAAVHRALVAGQRGLGAPEADELSALGAPAGEIRGFDASAYAGKGNYRPLDRTGRLAVAAAALALEAGGWGPEVRRERRMGLVLGTMFGSVRTIAEFDRRALTAGPNYVKPFDFANSVINAAAGQAAIWHGLPGVNATVAGGTGAGVQALAHGADLVASGRAEAVLAGGADELCLESFLGFRRAGLLCGDNGRSGAPRPVPFDAARDGFAPAEGAALLILETAEGAARRGARVLGSVLGHGAAFDPSRGRDAASAAGAVARAVRGALAAAGLGADELLCASVSASGSPALDRAEAVGLEEALGPAARDLPVTAVKSGLGEALGASGTFQAALLLEAMAAGELPGVVGLEEVEPGLPLSGVGPEPVALAPRGDRPPAGLVTALDRHGGAHALVLGGVPAGPGRPERARVADPEEASRE